MPSGPFVANSVCTNSGLVGFAQVVDDDDVAALARHERVPGAAELGDREPFGLWPLLGGAIVVVDAVRDGDLLEGVARVPDDLAGANVEDSSNRECRRTGRPRWRSRPGSE